MTVTARPTSSPWLLFGLWALTGSAFVLSFLGMFSIGIFVLPFAVALLVWAIVLTVRRPESWPSIAGLGLALALGLVWFGTILGGSARFDQLSCSGGSDVPMTCTSYGQVVDPDAFEWANATPWFAAAFAVGLLTFVSHAAARKIVTATGQRPEPGPAH